MKTIDIKSLLIGGLLASTILLGIAAVSKHTGNGRFQQWIEPTGQGMGILDTTNGELYITSAKESDKGWQKAVEIK